MGRSLNLLALPKDPDFMKVFKAREGEVLVQADLATIEPRVLAHFSQDPNLLLIFGHQAWPGHDMYLIGGMRVPVLGDKIAAVYNLKNPTKESVKAAKSQFAEERAGKLKPGFLGWQYGIGADTLHVKLEISIVEARAILRGLDAQFPGRRSLHNKLEREWAKNGGYIVNGRGRPICVDFGLKKDLVSRMVQSSAHDVLMRILWHMNSYRKQHNILMRPYIPDLHDETIWQCKPDQVDKVKEAINYALDRTNDEFGWSVTIKHGGIHVGDTLAIRCEE